MQTYTPNEARKLVLREAPPSTLKYPVYLMGAYSLQEVFEEQDVPEHYDDPLIDYTQETNMWKALKKLRDFIRSEYGFRAFIASDIPIFTHYEAEKSSNPDAHGMSPACQSQMYSTVSNAIIYVFPYVGHTDGVANELGRVVEFLNLSFELPGSPKKPPERCFVFKHHDHSSATIDEHRHECCMIYDEYRFADEIEPKIKNFLEAVFDADVNRSDNEFPVHTVSDEHCFRAFRPDERLE